MYREIENIPARQGLTPIIAHVDRYIAPFRTHGIPEKLASMPVLVQANASFFTRSATRRMALRMLKRNQIHLLGSDCHNLDSRMPNLGDAINILERSLSDNITEQICIYQNEVLGEDM